MDAPRAWLGRGNGAALREDGPTPPLQAATGDSGDADPTVGAASIEVNSFLLAESARCSVGAAKGRVAELRSLLRYLFVRGLTATALAAAVPPVAGWHNSCIPPNLSPADIQALLD